MLVYQRVNYVVVPVNRGTPSHHPFDFRMFHEINHPAIGVPNYGNPHMCSLMFQGPTFNLPEGISHIGRPFLDDSLLPSHM